ncbi:MULTISPECIES: sugar phosphate isomerase/epimerase family protein [unclassified Clostridium]|uniref:sugar phosphate isomerase/epimerase family protein n=1 Tax=unclassified Clostridium TaxID=2614128 RepID=UPI0014858DB8|nr:MULTISPECIES: sugar phosphate isomerase/epimerase family protein [unclassified Clostridium]
MELGFFSPEISGQNVEEVFAKARALGFTQVQYDFETSHGEEMPAGFGPGELERVAQAARDNGVSIAAVNGTFNMVDSDPIRLEAYIRRFTAIAQACAYFGCKIVTLCTGSKSPEGMWRYSPATAGEPVFQQLLETTRRILPVAESYGLTLGVETEASNVVFTARRTRRYLDEIASPHLKVIMDCANLFPAGTARRENVAATIGEAFSLLGGDIVLAHGKDVAEGDAVRFSSPGMGIVDYDLYFDLLKKIGYSGPLILHGVHDPADFAPSIAIMRQKLLAAGL